MEGARCWCRLSVVEPDGSISSTVRLDGWGHPGIATVDAIARRMLGATRMGQRVLLQDVDPELVDLLRLVGLSVDMERQPEGGKETLGIHHVEEERHLGDPTV